ncbi:MAG: ribose 5-phosphate isomerase B, partial [Bryobacteraceae bacterium]
TFRGVLFPPWRNWNSPFAKAYYLPKPTIWSQAAIPKTVKHPRTGGAPQWPACYNKLPFYLSMRIAIGADHAGFSLKESLRERLRAVGHEVVDHGTHSPDSVDYPDMAASVARAVASGESERGVLVCNTGVGMSIAANKIHGVRAALGVTEDEVRLTREHNDANVLTLGAVLSNAETAAKLLDVFLATPFQGGRHARRIAKIADLEKDD